MSEPVKSSRRHFLGKALAGGALAALAGGTAWMSRLWRGPSAPVSPSARRKLGDEFFYDVERFRHVPEELIRYRQVAELDPQLRAVRSIAIGPDGTIAVAGEKRVRLLSPDGAIRLDMETAGLPRGLSWRGDELLVGVRDHLELYSPDGTLRLAFAPIEGAHLTSVDLIDDDVFAADAANRMVWHHDRSGKLIGPIGARDEERGIPGFVVPSPFFALRIAPDGLLRVVNPGRHRVEAYTFRGDLEFSWGTTSMAIDGFCGCCNPVNFTILPDGRFVTCEKGLPRVKIHAADGTFESVVAPPALFPENEAACAGGDASTCTRGGLDVAVAPDGRIHILDIVTRRIRVMEEITA